MGGWWICSLASRGTVRRKYCNHVNFQVRQQRLPSSRIRYLLTTFKPGCRTLTVDTQEFSAFGCLPN